MFSAPVEIAANTIYVASYFAPNGHYAANGKYFSESHSRPPLLAPASRVDDGNGVFKYGASTPEVVTHNL